MTRSLTPWHFPDQPFNSLAPPPDKDFLESVPVLRKSIAANKALAELKGLCLSLPEPKLLIDTILLQESKDSSAIENIVTTDDQLYRAILNPLDSAPAPVKEVLRYREAVHAGMEAMQRTNGLSSNCAVAVMRRIRNVQVGLRDQPGIQLKNPATQKVIYTPPDHGLVQSMMAQWEHFVHAEDGMDPLIRMAAMHYHFEAIHPFSDGNGRTGRIINVLYLVQAGLLDQPVLYHSGYIIQHKSDYYRSLRLVTESGEWEAWLIFMLNAVEQTAKHTQSLIRSIIDLRTTLTQQMRGISQKLPVTDLADLLFTLPYVKIATLEERGLGSRPTATSYLRALAEPSRNVLLEMKHGREIYFVNHQLMELLAKPAAWS